MKQLYLLIIFLSINCFSQNEFITVWKTSSTETNIETSISFNTPVNNSTYTYAWQQVDEDYTELTPYSSGTIVPINNGNLTINFPENGFYRIKITSNSTEFHIKVNSPKLLAIEQWGNINWSSFEKSFMSCTNLDVTATDIPNLENVTDISNMFFGCTSLIFNNSISNWQTTNIQNFKNMFAHTMLFNQPIGDWDTSSARSLNHMFANAGAFNQFIGNWDVSNVIDFQGMFHNNPIYNQPLKDWNTESAIDLSHLFCAATQFNQDVSTFNVTQATDVSWFVFGAINFNQSLATWQLNSITDGDLFFDFSGIDCVNFTNTLLGWSNNTNLPNSITLGITDMVYSDSIIPTLNWYTNTKNWTFQGSFNQTETCSLSNSNFDKTLLKIYPNPTSNLINIEGIKVEKVDIYDTKGSLVQKALNNNKIDITQLSSGNYILIINDQYQEKLIKK